MAVPCEDFCDLPTSRILDQSAMRYNDRSAFANNASQDAYNHMAQIVTAEALNTLQQHGMASAILAMRSVVSQPG